MGACTTTTALLCFSLGLLLLPVTDQAQPTDNGKEAEYLTRYGYMSGGDSMENAYMTMQMDLGLPITGILDKQTQDEMKKPRCGFTNRRTTAQRRRVKRFSRFGFQWGHKAITYTIREVNGVYTSRLPNNIVETIISYAFMAWSRVTPLTFTRLRGLHFVGDIDFSFQRGIHDDFFPFDGRGGTLAHALIPETFFFNFVRVHFDDDERWTIHSPEASLYQIAMHEIGHALGLDHSERRDAIMHAIYAYKSNLELTHDDILGAQTLYGDQNGNQPDPTTRTTTTTTTTRRPNTTPSTTPTPPTTSFTNTAPPLKTRSPLLYQTTSRGHFHQYFTSRFPSFQLFTTPRYKYEPINGRTTHGRFGWTTPTTVPAVFRSKVAQIVQAPSICSDNIVVDAVFSLEDIMTTYIFQGNVYYKMTKDVPSPGYPRRINQTFPEVGNAVDAALSIRETSSKGGVETMIYLFKGNRVWKYNTTFNPVWPGDGSRNISEHFQGAPTDIDSAFYYKQYNAIYFFKGTSYYRLSQYLNITDNELVVDQGYPQPISKWNLPPEVRHVDAAFTWQRNFRTYLFSGTQYYRLDDHQSSMDTQTLLPYPRSTRMWWLGCYSPVPLGAATPHIICRPEIEALDLFTVDETSEGNVMVSRQSRECRIIHNQAQSRPADNVLPDTSGYSRSKSTIFISIHFIIVIHILCP